MDVSRDLVELLADIYNANAGRTDNPAVVDYLKRLASKIHQPHEDDEM
jgi:hypothetical protein